VCFDAEYPSVFDAELRCARKEHRCIECRGTIAIGEKYHYASGCTDGKWWHVRSCLACERVRDLVFDYEVAEGCSETDANCPYGELREYVRDAGGIGSLLFYAPRTVAGRPRTEVMSVKEGSES